MHLASSAKVFAGHSLADKHVGCNLVHQTILSLITFVGACPGKVHCCQGACPVSVVFLPFDRSI